MSPNPSSVLITFENYPFSEVEVFKYSAATGRPLAGAHFRIQGFFVEGNAPQIMDQTLVTDGSGRVLFQGLPAGSYTVSEVFPPPGYMISEPVFQNVNVSWGQVVGHPSRPAPRLHFYNQPLAYLEVIKIDGNTNAGLPGATFELREQLLNCEILRRVTLGKA